VHEIHFSHHLQYLEAIHWNHFRDYLVALVSYLFNFFAKEKVLQIHFPVKCFLVSIGENTLFLCRSHRGRAFIEKRAYDHLRQSHLLPRYISHV
jgi:hypothetical protein